MTRAYAFTGPEHVEPWIAPPLKERLAELPVPGHVITGAALGVDTIACRLALDLWPLAEHTILVPNFRHNKALIAEMESRDVTIIYMPDTTGPLERNVEMVERATHLVAVPKHEKWYRSGTWHTINAAHRRRVPVIMLPVPVLLGQGTVAS